MAKCLILDCARVGAARGLCKSHYNKAYLAGTLPDVDRSHQHRVTDVDVETSTGRCSICGPVRVRMRIRDGRSGGSECLKNRRARLRRAKYSLTKEDLESLIESQGAACAICRCTDKPLVIDHDHKCCPGHKSCGNCVRGLLCDTCNKKLSWFNDDPDVLAQASVYLYAYLAKRANQSQ